DQKHENTTHEQANIITQDDSDTEKKTPRTNSGSDLKEPAQQLSRQIPFLEQHSIDKIKFYNGSRLSISKAKKVYLTKDSAGIAKSFKEEFENQGINAELIEFSSTKIPELRDAAGIVVIPEISEINDSTQTADFLKYSFKLVKKNAPYLTESASQKSAFFATVSFLGGGFGFDNKEIIDPVQGGLAGLAKTAGLEWKDILCKALDMPCSVKEVIENAEDAITLMMTHGSVEIGISNGLCNIPKLKTEGIPVFKESDLTNKAIAKDDLFVITGGAKGVTAECAIEIAKSFSPKIMLIGRSENPTIEPDWAKGISSESDIKKAILKNQFANQTPKPVELEKSYRQLMSNREIKETIQQIENSGSTIEYFSCDIQKKDQISEIFNTIRKKYGDITGIIHGAGILEDKLIIEKNYDKFCTVFDTKVSGLNSLVHASENDNLKYFIGFSSVAARTGNIGQSDYSMANEVLNKTLQKLSFKNPECKYLSMNWGPWDGGMVNQSLKKEFQKRKVDLINKKAGAYQLIAEMSRENQTDIEIVIGGGLFGKEEKQKTSLTKAFNYNLNSFSAPVLQSHKINNNMVVPFAVHMELLAHAAEKNNPGLSFAGIDQMRLLKGISFPEGSTGGSIEISAKTGKCKKAEQGFETETNIFSEDNTDKTFLNSAGIALLKESLPNPPVLSASSSLDLVPYSLSVDEIYESVLFHGKDLHAIKSITGCSIKGIEITASQAPSPDTWFKSPPLRDWIFDPMLLDAAFQAAILWTYENKKQVCLPSYITNFRLYNSFKKPEGDVRIRFTVNETSKHKIRGYFTFLDINNKILASITGFEAINDPSLINKFKKTKELISKEKILAFAEGNPSEAFGDKYKVFDNERQMARLPRPPYFFMDRVTKIDHTQWEMKSGGWIEAEFDVPANGWYFNSNHSDSIPFCILLEIALQPCGWLAAWAGSALKSNNRLYFRNLGGKAQFFKNINRKIGTIMMRSRITDVSQAGGMIIQDYDIEVLKNDELLYKGSTNFGFFSSQSLSNQIGLKNNKFHTYEIDASLLDTSKEIIFQDNAPLTPEDLNIDENQGMPSTALRMIDRIEQFSLKGGLYNKGYIKATKLVNPDEWFFNAHFYQDPVCPGSLGIESFLQLLRFYSLQKWQYSPKDFKINETLNTIHEWKYRGQIIPSNKKIEICAHIKDIINGDQPQIIADGALSVDGICIYEMIDFNVTLADNGNSKLIKKTKQEKAER
ncbi:MAG: SDR family NAD(P)-dependent oxidoreductase, partial [Desulfobacteraceae bacterium]|nr:SDR family NAD(P)-dependent oxidoreductase [Desulfobacteraceae bacterium]